MSSRAPLSRGNDIRELTNFSILANEMLCLANKMLYEMDVKLCERFVRHDLDTFPTFFDEASKRTNR